MLKILTFTVLVSIFHSATLTADSTLIWRGDFETGDLSQWNYLINPQGLSVQTACTYEGKWAGKATITGDSEFLWHGNTNLNRTEFEYKPATTPPNTDTFFGWSFLLPKPFTSNRHEFGYWESDKSWQQNLRFNIHSSNLSFQETAQDQPFWMRNDIIHANQWHDIAVHIHWSDDPTKGFVKVWFDGKFVSEEPMQTLANIEHSMFVHLGLLRHQEATIETIYIDNARHGKSIESILAGFNTTQIKTCATNTKQKLDQ